MKSSVITVSMCIIALAITGIYSLYKPVYAEIIIEKSKQNVDVNGSIINQANTGGNAQMDISSNTGSQKISNNNQQVKIKGSVYNSAEDGAKGSMNIASKTHSLTGKSGKQIVVVDGPTINIVSGRGVKSEVNIGGK